MLHCRSRSRAFAAALLLSAPVAAAFPAAALELSVWTNLTTASQADVIRKQIDACLKDTPQVTAKLETVPFGNMYTRLIAAAKKGDVPNLMNTLEGAVAFLLAQNAILPLDDVVDTIGRNDFRQSYLNAVQKDGKTWGVPDWALHQEVWYRKDLLEKAGLPVPRSWEELLAAAKALTKDNDGDGRTDVYGFAVPLGRALVAPQTFFQVFYSAGGTVFDPKTGEYVFNQKRDEAVKSVRLLVDLYKAASPPASIEWSWSEYRTAFVKGQVAMTNEWGAVVLMAQEQNPEMLDKIGVFPFPAPTKDVKPAASLSGGYYYLVGKSSEEKVKASKQLLACLYKTERVAERANSRPIFAIPATQSAFDSQTYQSNAMVKKFRPELETIFNEVMGSWYRYGMEAGVHPLAGQIEATSFIGDALQSAALGRITAEQAVDQMNEQLAYQASLLRN